MTIGPEVVALVLSIVVAVGLGGGILSGARLPDGGSGPTTAAVSPSGATSPTPTPGPSVNAAAVTVCLQIDARLIEDRKALAAELAAKPLEASNVAAILRSANADLLQATDIAAHLGPTSEARALSGELTAYYGDLHTVISDGLKNSVQNVAAYRSLATVVVATLKKVEAFDVRLSALLESDGPSPAAASGSPAPADSPRPGGSPAATPTASPVPPTASPVASASSGVGPGPSAAPPTAGGPVNPGFEAGVGAPWELVVAATAQASLQEDRAIHAGGAVAARLDIAAAGEERAAVALRQGGLLIEAGSHYVVTIVARAETTRELRIRIASAAGDTYGTRLFTIGPTWQTLTLDATVLATDANAYLEVDLGRFAVTTWIDDTSFGRVAATGG